MNDLLFFSDKCLISELPEQLSEAMKLNEIIAPEHSKLHFCGIFSWGGRTAIFLPANCDLQYKPDLSSHYLIKSINKYYNENGTGVKSLDNNQLIGGEFLSLIITLYDDYLANGIYVRRVRKSTVNNGKINWPHTISHHMPFQTGGTPIYLEYTSSQIRYTSDCETSRIHAQVIRDIISTFGVLLNGNSYFSNEALDLVCPPTGDYDSQLSFLNRELSMSYSDRDIILINLLRQYIEKSGKISDGSLIIGTSNFHYMWEHMLNHALSGIKNFNKKLPVPYYRSNDLYHEVAEKGQRTDIIIENHDKTHFAVVDAKYYTALSPQEAPGWPDLVKQFFYQKAVSAIVGEKASVSTHFIFPGNEDILRSAHVGYRGQHGTKFLNHTDGYPIIYCHYCDPVILMKAYISRGKLPDLRSEIFNI
ncbi:LlaJI family restriction endonuclease [Aeromonas jandaei]|uniref:LlaJI family restriction endonuclease n=1 Tax=Aeromonas jandaei TaxID=650 RepID=UPI00398719D4